MSDQLLLFELPAPEPKEPSPLRIWEGNEWCWDCGGQPPVWTAGLDTDDPTLCRGCNDDRNAEAAAAWEGLP